MVYYCVKPEFNNKVKIHKNYSKTKHHYKYDIFIANELYTARELNTMRKKGIIFNDNMFDTVEIPKSKIYWMFGARFASIGKLK